MTERQLRDAIAGALMGGLAAAWAQVAAYFLARWW